MPPQFPNRPDMKVLDWLGLDSQGVPYYLHPLNLVWSPGGAERDLELYRQVAIRLANEPAYWSELIRALSWRECLVGCTALLVLNCRENFEDLKYRLRGGSFVAPQIAVTMGLLHSHEARQFLPTAIDEAVQQDRPKVAASAYQVLLRLGETPGRKIFAESGTQSWMDNVLVAEGVVRRHWDFWSGRIIT